MSATRCGGEPPSRTDRARRSVLQLAAATALAPRVVVAQQAVAADVSPTLKAAVDGVHRSAEHRARDAARHPVQTLLFFGLTPTQTVVELAPGSGWYTEILAPVLRDAGRLYAAHEAADAADPAHGRERAEFDAATAAAPALYGRVVNVMLPRSSALAGFAPRGSADLVLTFRGVHNWLAAGLLDGVLQACRRLLAPGGTLGVVDHRAAPGTSLDRMRRSGYVTEALMADRAAAAGFALQARSEVNANPRDTRDHPHGVWSLPPVLSGGDADRARFVAIGESDRFTHRYVKR